MVELWKTNESSETEVSLELGSHKNNFDVHFDKINVGTKSLMCDL